MNIDQLSTIFIAIVSSSVISVIVSSVVNHNKLNAEIQRLHGEAATDTINNYRALVADQKSCIDDLKMHIASADRSINLIPVLTRRIEELEVELKRQREQAAALYALSKVETTS